MLRTFSAVVMGAVAVGGSTCTKGDITRIGDMSNISTSLTACAQVNTDLQAIAQCIIDDYPGILSVSQECRICTLAVLRARADTCSRACTSGSEPNCLDCLNSLESDWKAACDPSSAVKTGLAASISVYLLITLIL